MAASRKKPPDLLAHLLSHWPAKLSGQCSFEVALSGGLDSTVLLHLLYRARQQLPDMSLGAVHVHHGLSPHADAWAAHCQSLCANWHVPLRIERVCVETSGGQSLEAEARRLRYQSFDASAAKVIVLAHHQDDQAETVMLQALRGGGVKAMAAMAELHRWRDKWLWRPLLSMSRSQLEDYAREYALTWVDDESNADTRWRRNLLRHDIFPVLQNSLPQYRQHLCRTARLMADAADVLDEVACQDLQACRRDGGLELSAWLALSPARQRLVLLEWLRQLSEPLPAPAALEEFQRQVIKSQAVAHPALALSGHTLVRFAGQLVAVEHLRGPLPEQTVLAPLRQDCALDVSEWSGRLVLEWRPGGLVSEILAAGAVLRPRVGGERLALKVGRKPVKTLLQEHAMPPLLRQQWPLLYSLDGQLLAIPGVAVAADYQSSGLGLWPIWQAGCQ